LSLNLNLSWIWEWRKEDKKRIKKNKRNVVWAQFPEAHLAFPFPRARPVSHSSPHSLHAAPLPRSTICQAHPIDTLRARATYPLITDWLDPLGSSVFPAGARRGPPVGARFPQSPWVLGGLHQAPWALLFLWARSKQRIIQEIYLSNEFLSAKIILELFNLYKIHFYSFLVHSSSYNFIILLFIK
jgi:hypothetical protein